MTSSHTCFNQSRVHHSESQWPLGKSGVSVWRFNAGAG